MGVMIRDASFILLNIYSPNKTVEQIPFFSNILTMLDELESFTAIGAVSSLSSESLTFTYMLSGTIMVGR